MNTLLNSMLSHADPSQVEGLSRFFKTGPGQYGEGDKFLGIKVPVTRSVVKECWRKVTFEDLEECICSEYHEVRLSALLALVEIFKHSSSSRPSTVRPLSFRPSTVRPLSFRPSEARGEIPRACIDFYLSHTPYINNWDLVDLSCYPLLGEWLLDKDRSLLYDLARNGRTIWEQRIGIVSTMTFIRHGELIDTFAIADILLHHPHDLIHKAVGWLLREAGKRDKPALVDYLQGPAPSLSSSQPSRPLSSRAQSRDLPRYLEMPRTMLRYAIEKFPEEERKSYLTGHAH